MQHGIKFLELVDQARNNVVECDLEFLHEVVLTKNKSYLIIDVRDESEFMKGHVQNALHLSRGTIEVKIEKIIPEQGQKILLYCGGGYRSILAAESLGKMGYVNVMSVKGGMRAWNQNDYKLDR